MAGCDLDVIAWIWVRTVNSPNPAFANNAVPLASTFVLSSKKGHEAFVEPIVDDSGYRFAVRKGPLPDDAKAGTKLSRGSFRCVMSGSAISSSYIKAEAGAGRLGTRLMAIAATSGRGRVYLLPTAHTKRLPVPRRTQKTQMSSSSRMPLAFELETTECRNGATSSRASIGRAFGI